MRLTTFVCFILTAFNAVSADSLWNVLRTESNMVVMMRHAYAEGGDPLIWDESGNCRGERLLSRRGEALAVTMGKRFRVEGIKPFVISSPMCRCRQTADLAFGSYIVDPALRVIDGDGQIESFQRKTRQLLLKHRGSIPVVFVSHRPNVDTLTMELIEFGDIVVGRIDDQGEIEVIGRARIEH